MKLSEITQFDFVTDEGYRYKISPRKAYNTFTLEAVLNVLKNNGYKFYQICVGGYIYAEKAN